MTTTPLTKENFIEAFWQLYQEKPIEKISVRELCEIAGYNRTTFYDHFTNIYDLLDLAVEPLLVPSKKLLQQLLFSSEPLIPDEFPMLYLGFFQEKQDYLKLLLQNNHQFVLENKIRKIVAETLKEYAHYNTTIDYLIGYQLSGILGILKTWFEKDKNISEKELIQLLYEISSNGVLALLKR